MKSFFSTIRKGHAFLIFMIAFNFLICVPAAFPGEKKETKAQTTPPAKIRIKKAFEGTASETVKIIGIIYYDRISNVSSETSGLIQTIYFKEGMRVNEGDVLLKTETSLLNKDLELESLKLKNNLVKIEKTKKDLARYEELFENDAASEIDFEDLTYELQHYEIERETILKSIEKLKLTLSKTVIHAPFDGIVLVKSTDVGEWIVPGKNIVKIASLKDLYAKAPIFENNMAYISKGESVNVIINAYKKAVDGEITGTLQEADPKTKNVFIKIKLPVMDNVVENMSVTVFVPVGEKKSMTFVPRDALIKAKGKDFVYTVKDGKAVIIPVEIISYKGADAGISSPHVKPGMEVIVEGNERLRPDQPVFIEETNTQPIKGDDKKE